MGDEARVEDVVDIAGRGAPEDWRRSVRLGMMNVAAVIAPAVVAVALGVRTKPRPPFDIAVLVASAALISGLRFVRTWSAASRALAMILIASATSIYLLGRIGLTAGISVSLATFSVLALVCASRSVGLLIIGVSALAYLLVGLIASHHLVRLAPTDADPYLLRNWVRMGTTSSLLSLLLMAVVDFVIRHVERSSREATQALARLQLLASERAGRERDLRVAYDRLGQLNRQLEATKEEERRSLSRELHDELGQTLTALKLRLQFAGRVVEPTVGAGAGQLGPVALVDDLIARVRKISVDLRPPLLDEVGLVSALRVYLEGQAAVAGLSIEFQAEESPRGADRLPPDFEIACFRVVQESVTNALRHAGARRLQVRITRAADRIWIAIRDDGRGFDLGTLDAAAARGHLGVVGMQERIRARGGVFKLTSAPGQGTTVEVELAAPPAEAASAG